MSDQTPIFTDAEFKMTWDLLMSVARTAMYIPVEDVEKLLQTAAHAHALGPILDPTAYRDGGLKNIEDQETLARGFLAFRKAIDEVRSNQR